jgi:phage gp29-like protein
MLYNEIGKKIIDYIGAKVNPGRRVFAEPSDREEYDVSRGLTPAKLDQIMIAANGGEPAEQSRLCRELVEKNWDIAHAIETRRNAVMGVGWEVQPGGESAADKKAAEELEATLQAAGGLNGLDSLNSLLADLQSALLPGFSVSEICWKEGGEVAGFNFIEQQHFTFRHNRNPYLMTRDNYDGIALELHQFIVHKYRRRGGDVTRGGLIRPLAWLHCFSSVNIKDLLSFVERYGMPFVVAKVDDQTWDKERSVLRGLIRNFGPSGGGLFTRGTEIELLQAANNGGDVYFKLLEYIGKAITKIILGQTATAGDGGGWSADNAQAQVRQDILEADCDALGDTLTMQLAAPWTMYTQPPGTKVPIITLPCVPPEDTVKKYEAIQARYTAMGIAIRAGVLTPSEDLEAAAREELDLPEVSTEVKANWGKNKGVKAPITLKDAPKTPEQLAADLKKDTMSMAAEPLHPAVSTKADATLIDNTAAEIINTGAANAWLGPMEKEISNISEMNDEELAEWLSDPENAGASLLDLFADSEQLQKALQNEAFAAAADGKIKKTKELKGK